MRFLHSCIKIFLDAMIGKQRPFTDDEEAFLRSVIEKKSEPTGINIFDYFDQKPDKETQTANDES